MTYASLFNYVICFVIGGVFVFFFIKGGSTLQHNKIVRGLEADKINLQNRNLNLGEVIATNQKDIKELKEAVAVLSNQIVQCQEWLAVITTIREQINDINAEIVITKRFYKKYERYLPE